MTQDKLEELIIRADRTAGPPAPVSVSLSDIRRRAQRKPMFTTARCAAAAALILIPLAIISNRTHKTQPQPPQQKIASLEQQIKHLQVTTDAALNLIREVLEDDRKQRRLDTLNAHLESIPDPLDEIRKEVDKTAFTIVYQADRLYYELSQTDSAVEAYNQVITLFPNNQWANVARRRLADINASKINKANPQGDSKWNSQNAPPSC